jgi:hypothetical protein
MIPDSYAAYTHAQNIVFDDDLLLPTPNACAQSTLSLQATSDPIQSMYSSRTVHRSHQQQSSSPALQPSVPRTAPDTLIMPPFPPRRGLRSVDGWIWSAGKATRQRPTLCITSHTTPGTKPGPPW